MKLSKITLIAVLTFILLLNVIVGHFLPPVGILVVYPIIMPIMIGLILFTDNGFGILIKSALCYLYIGLNDIGIRLFAGGIHDLEGQGFLTLFLFIGLIICFIMLVRAVYIEVEPKKWIKTISILGFILLVYAHIELFQKLGIDARYR